MACLIFDQPKTPHGTRLAKSRALFLLLPDKDCRKINLACFGNKGHYKKPSGICVHVISVLSGLKSDWHRRRAYYLPFGDNTKTPVKAMLDGREWGEFPS